MEGEENWKSQQDLVWQLHALPGAQRRKAGGQHTSGRAPPGPPAPGSLGLLVNQALLSESLS